MAYVKWKDMTPAQRVEATKLRPHLHMSDFPRFAYWIKPDGHVSRRGGHHELTEEAYNAEIAKYYGPPDDKGGLTKWKPGVIFHFSRD